MIEIIRNKLSINEIKLLEILLEDNNVLLMNNFDLKRYLEYKSININKIIFENSNVIKKLEYLTIEINLFDKRISFIFEHNVEEIKIIELYEKNILKEIRYKTKNSNVNYISTYLEDTNKIKIKYQDDSEEMIDKNILEVIMNDLTSNNLIDIINLKTDINLSINNNRNIALKKLINDFSYINSILNRKEIVL